jgi:hypothetical protein
MKGEIEITKYCYCFNREDGLQIEKSQASPVCPQTTHPDSSFTEQRLGICVYVKTFFFFITSSHTHLVTKTFSSLLFTSHVPQKLLPSPLRLPSGPESGRTPSPFLPISCPYKENNLSSNFLTM